MVYAVCKICTSVFVLSCKMNIIIYPTGRHDAEMAGLQGSYAYSLPRSTEVVAPAVSEHYQDRLSDLTNEVDEGPFKADKTAPHAETRQDLNLKRCTLKPLLSQGLHAAVRYTHGPQGGYHIINLCTCMTQKASWTAKVCQFLKTCTKNTKNQYVTYCCGPPGDSDMVRCSVRPVGARLRYTFEPLCRLEPQRFTA